ncbi:hypothetical protein M5D96_011689 [Drosophila gunungcola]|uniref:HAT C-terminal dimerisation domain-containing protein n=1 Tax=Drosophila gunungcola TaxID=103775 RepID=A0A9P9YEL1_9MUSC|nr:hypothetical protein M5D96_011689 [Drosophila gunungcola]
MFVLRLLLRSLRNMPKVTYMQNFRDSWLNFEEFKQWLRKGPTDSTKAYCCFCKVSIGAKLFEIRQHAQAKKHIACIASVAQNHTIHFGRQPTKTEEQEVALALFALHILSLPWSNAAVERVFSQMNMVKTKLRNKMNLKSLNAILRIRYGLRRHGKCCHDYILPTKYLALVSSSAKYMESNDEVDEIISLL